MVNLGTLRPPRSGAEALGNGAIPAELATILAAHSRTVREDGTACTLEVRSVRVIHYLLAELASGVAPIPSLERAKTVRLDPDGRVLLMHSLFSVQVNVYSTQRYLFACLGELPAKPPPTLC